MAADRIEALYYEVKIPGKEYDNWKKMLQAGEIIPQEAIGFILGLETKITWVDHGEN